MDDLENLDMIDQILATDAKQTILQEMGLQNRECFYLFSFPSPII